MSDAPSLQALLVADQLIMDANRRKWSAVGIFTHVLGPVFPLVHAGMDVFALIVDPPSRGSVTVSLATPAGLTVTGHTQPFQVKDITQAVEIGVHFSHVEFRAPGRYSVQVHVNEQFVGQCTLWAKKIGPGPGPGPDAGEEA